MTKYEKKLLITIIRKYITSIKDLKLRLGAPAKSFAEAMHKGNLQSGYEDLHDIINLDLLTRIDKRIKQLEEITKQVENL
jgi:division protein CdvB (Snf7/Vps24/ESCRT-III family)